MRGIFALALLAICCTAKAQECTSDNERIDCFPNALSSEETCQARGCTWCPAQVDGLNVPWCYVPQGYGYKSVGEVVATPNGFKINLQRASNVSYFGNDAEALTLEAEFQSDYRLRIKITDGTPRFEVPLKINPASGGNSNPLYSVETTNEPVFSFKVIRKSSGVVLFDTSLGGLTFSSQFIQFSTKLPNKNLYGIGENEQHSFRHSFEKYPVWPLFARDQPPDGNANMYGVHPHYTVLENDGSAHSVVIVNSNAQEFVILPAPGLLYRTLGGVLDLYFFLGPTPENTVQQYTEAVGRTDIPPYWSLGFQLCKFPYSNLENMKAAQQRTRQANIPQDVQYGDIDIMERQMDFTLSVDRFGGLPDYIKDLKSQGMKFITILDPAIAIGEPAGSYRPYELGNEMDIWIKKADGTPAVGRVWPDSPTHFPDYSKNVTRQWWITLIKDFKNTIDFDGLWIDMNEPSNFVSGELDEGCAQNALNKPPFVPQIRGGSLEASTLCPDTRSSAGNHYDTHNLYGWFQQEPTRAGILAAMPTKRPVTLSRSTFLGSGKWTAHWLGDNFSNWPNLRYSIIGMLQFNQFGIPFVGADICGFLGDSNAELCQRWQELGAFYPFARNHNAGKEQDPAVWGPEVAESSRKALEIRYTLLPHLYTLFYQHFTQGNTVARALWHEFPSDVNAAGVDAQFLWGSGFMVSPVLDEGATSVEIYFPNARWFSYHDGSEVSTRRDRVTLPAPRDFIHLHVRGGIIYPTQEPALNTELARQNPMGLIVALGDDDAAEGHIYYDDGISNDSYTSDKYYFARYVYQNGQLETIVEHDGYPRMAELRLQTIRLLGSKNISRATIDGKQINLVKSAGGEITMRNVDLPANKPFTIKFE